jgi:hypothetical protein
LNLQLSVRTENGHPALVLSGELDIAVVGLA